MSTIYRLPEVMKITGLSAPTIWRMEKRGDFPIRFKLSLRAVGWNSDDIEKWVRDRSK